jgi:hypothetical protein
MPTKASVESRYIVHSVYGKGGPSLVLADTVGAADEEMHVHPLGLRKARGQPSKMVRSEKMTAR